MNAKQKKLVMGSVFGIAAVQVIGLLIVIGSFQSMVQGIPTEYLESFNRASAMIAAAVWPAVIISSLLMSLKLTLRESHYGWMGLCASAALCLPSLAFPFAAVILYVLLSPAVRRPMLEKINTEWGLTE